MNTKAIIGGIVGAILYFFLGWVVWGMLLMKMMEPYINTTCMRPEAEMNWVLLIMANLFWGLGLGYIFSKSNVNTFASGAVMGAIINVLFGISIDLFMYNFHTIMNSLTPAWYNIGANLVVGAIVGGIMGAVMGMLSARK